MKYVSAKYEAQLAELADTLCTPERFGKPALQGAVEPVFPHGLTRKDPVEHGWNAEPKGATILSFPMAQVVELHTPNNIQRGTE